MKKAKYINRNSIEVIDYDEEVKRIEKSYDDDIIFWNVSDDIIQSIMEKTSEEKTSEDLEKLERRENIEEDKKVALKLLCDYQDFVETAFDGELGELETAVPYYVNKNKTIIQKWDIIKGDESKILLKINLLKSELSDLDYRIMKCYESSILGNELPNDMNELIAERQKKRDEINRLEEIIK